MLLIDLCGNYVLQCKKSNALVNAVVPGTVLTDLVREQIIDDPFYRDNESHALALSYDEYTYSKDFVLKDSDIDFDAIELICEGLDTIADVYINDTHVLHAGNMHREWRKDIKSVIFAGQNSIRVEFSSPTDYIENAYNNGSIQYHSGATMKGADRKSVV